MHIVMRVRLQVIELISQVCKSSYCRSDTSITSDICTDDGIGIGNFNNSRSHTISDTELQCVVTHSKKRKVYRKKKGQSRNFCTVQPLKTKAYLLPTVSGDNMKEIIEWSNEMKSQHTEVEVILQVPTSMIKIAL